MSLSQEWAKEVRRPGQLGGSDWRAGGFVAGTAQGAQGTDRWAGPASGELVNAIVTGLLFTLKAGGTLRRCFWEVGPLQLRLCSREEQKRLSLHFKSPPQGWKQKKCLFHIETNSL